MVSGPPGCVTHAEAAQFRLHGAVGVGDHAHRQAERGQVPQPGPHPGADVRPGPARGRLGHLGGQVAAPVLRDAAGGEVADEVLPPPGARHGRRAGQVLDHHRPVVGPLEGGHVRCEAKRPQRRPQQVGLREDKHAARVEQDRADPLAHTGTIRGSGASWPGRRHAGIRASGRDLARHQLGDARHPGPGLGVHDGGDLRPQVGEVQISPATWPRSGRCPRCRGNRRSSRPGTGRSGAGPSPRSCQCAATWRGTGRR